MDNNLEKLDLNENLEVLDIKSNVNDESNKISIIKVLLSLCFVEQEGLFKCYSSSMPSSPC